jgi:hypothetical protein
MSQQSGEGYVDEILGAGEIPWPGTEPRLSYVGGPPAPAIDPIPNAPEPVCWIVLTRQRDGSWLDDWDGEVHKSVTDGRASLAEARATLKEDVKLVVCYEAE